MIRGCEPEQKGLFYWIAMSLRHFSNTMHRIGRIIQLKLDHKWKSSNEVLIKRLRLQIDHLRNGNGLLGTPATQGETSPNLESDPALLNKTNKMENLSHLTYLMEFHTDMDRLVNPNGNKILRELAPLS